MKTSRARLSGKDREYLEHIRRAASSKVTLAEYSRTVGVSVQSLYNAQYRAKQAEGRQPGRLPGVERAARGAAFIEVRLPMAPRPEASVCRVRHPSGWVIECASWPSAQWIRACVQGGDDVAT